MKGDVENCYNILIPHATYENLLLSWDFVDLDMKKGWYLFHRNQGGRIKEDSRQIIN
uniref:Uncharacterized protein n=1 Tax=Rhizophagus irregularis (strain DAOM 181602 / DAOM 197198 / MUCL 43194) TaxID=747089 RepID=U9URH5_RHIID